MNSRTGWNLEELRKQVRAARVNAGELLDLISSVDRSARIFVYHMASARDAMKGLYGEGKNEAEELLFVFGASDRQHDFEHAKIVSEAHIIGALHTARGIWDLFAQLLNALVLSKPLPIDVCDIGRVARALPPSPLSDAVNRAMASYWYSYVMAFTNTTKHRRLVQHLVSVSFEQQRSGIKLAAFEYNQRSFPAYWDIEVLEGAIEVKNGIIECGQLLNAAARHDA
jgi:hypothetical protein